MKERIIRIMEREGMTAARFAEAIGAQRATLSHILSGRNNVSLEVTQKILERFPKLSSDWLLRGVGEMYRNERTPLSSASLPQPTLFGARFVSTSTPTSTSTSTLIPSSSGTSGTTASPTLTPNEKQTTPPLASLTTPSPVENPPISDPATPFASQPDKPPRHVVKIMIFYSDNTYDTFISERTSPKHT